MSSRSWLRGDGIRLHEGGLGKVDVVIVVAPSLLAPVAPEDEPGQDNQQEDTADDGADDDAGELATAELFLLGITLDERDSEPGCLVQAGEEATVDIRGKITGYDRGRCGVVVRRAVLELGGGVVVLVQCKSK
jgi:hypothetical protein